MRAGTTPMGPAPINLQMLQLLASILISAQLTKTLTFVPPEVLFFKKNVREN